MSIHDYLAMSDLRRLAVWVSLFLSLGTLALLSGPTAAATAPAVRPAAVCTFDGGGWSAAGSVTRTSDGRAWLCTDDGDLVPWGRPAIAGGVCSMPGVCAPDPLAAGR
jgi:hypothetical protein